MLAGSKEYESLLGGKLRGEMGLADPKAALDSVVRAVGNAVRVDVTAGAGQVLAGMRVQAVRSDFADALAADGARYDSVNAAGRVTKVEWLSWLLFAGDRVVIADYGVVRGSFDEFSRTGTHLMTKAFEKGRATPWRVPPEFSGTGTDNFLTRVADRAEPLVAAAVEKELRRVLR